MTGDRRSLAYKWKERLLKEKAKIDAVLSSLGIATYFCKNDKYI